MKKTFIVTDWSGQQYTVTIIKNVSIQIDCTYKNAHEPKPTSVSFNLNDSAEYDSYNLSYIGKIIGITDKTVTINPNYSEGNRRLKLGDFCWRNWDFNLDKKVAENAAEMQCI